MLKHLSDSDLLKYKSLYENTSKRVIGIKRYGIDVKFLYHVVRLLDECQMILEEHDLDITRSREHLKAIRNGEYSLDEIVQYFETKMISLENLYQKSTLRYSPDENYLKNLLLECIEMHYGSLDNMVSAERSIDKHVIDAYNALTKAMEMMK